jgi:hypothetical protein
MWRILKKLRIFAGNKETSIHEKRLPFQIGHLFKFVLEVYKLTLSLQKRLHFA